MMQNPIRIEFEESRLAAIAFDGTSEIGKCEFVIVSENLWEITHTRVNEDYGGQGIAKRLVLCLVEQARKAGAKILPTCSYAKKALAGEDFQDVRYEG